MRNWYRARAGDNDAGAILIIYAVILTTMVALSGFAVDFTRWSRIGTMEQRAADAAALAGAVYMPDDFSGAQTAAMAQASKNGFTNGQNNTTITVARGVRSNQLRVTISRQVTNLFGSIVGAKNTTITKEALAEYQRAVNMGSPSNQFGNNPEASSFNSTTYPNFWGSIAGPNTDKVQGDAISSKPCTSSSDNCSSSLNTEFDAKGYFYGVDVLPGATGTLTIQAYDPAFVEVGAQCGTDTNGSNLSGAAAMTTAQIQHYPTSSITPATRYNTSSTSKFCNGDQTYDGGGSTPTWTTFVVREPDASPWDPTDNPVLCSKNFPGYTGDIKTALQQTAFYPTGAPAFFAEYFRQWYTLCTVNSPVVGTYFVQINTSTKVDGTAAPNGHGQNRFSVRARLNGIDSNLAHTYGEGRMSIFANFDGSTAVLPLARIMPGASGRTIELSLFDAGDLQGTGTLQVKPAADAKDNGVTMSTFSGCTYTAPPGNSSGPPWGTFSNTASGCTLTGVSSSSYQGDWVSVRIPIPSTYTCDTTSTTGCWATVNYNFSGATSVTDTTTWTARIRGIPVRLIE
jgi:hypothetical protein